MSKYLVNASRILTLDSSEPIVNDGAIIVSDDRIEAIGTRAELSRMGPFDGTLGGTDCAIMPGLCNSHYHVGPGNTVRVGLLDSHLETWRLPVLGALMDPFAATASDLIYAATQYFACRMVRTGITSCLDFTHVLPESADYGLGPIVKAYQDLGMRASIAAGVTNRNAFVYEDDQSFLATLPSELARRVRQAPLASSYLTEDDYIAVMRAVHQEHDGSCNGLIRIFLSPYSPQWCTDSLMLRIKEVASELGTGIQLHLLETKYQMQYALRAYGKTAVAHLYEMGFLGDEVSCAHAVWITDADIDLLSESGAICVHNPLSNLRLGSGIARVRDLMQKNVGVAIGTDGMGFSDENDILNQLRLADYLQRIPGIGAQFIEPRRWLQAATGAGARVIGLGNEGGVLRAGAKADLLLVNLERIGRIGVDTDAIEQQFLQYLEPEDIRTVMIDGRIIMDERRILTADEDALASELKSAFPAMRDYFKRNLPLMDELEPYVSSYFKRWDTEPLRSAYQYNAR